MKKRVVSLLLCLIMALSLIPTVAFAAEPVAEEQQSVEQLDTLAGDPQATALLTRTLGWKYAKIEQTSAGGLTITQPSTDEDLSNNVTVTIEKPFGGKENMKQNTLYDTTFHPLYKKVRITADPNYYIAYVAFCCIGPENNSYNCTAPLLLRKGDESITSVSMTMWELSQKQSLLDHASYCWLMVMVKPIEETSAPTTGSLTIEKTVQGLKDEDTPDEFNFTITGDNNYSNTVSVSILDGLSATIANLSFGTYTITEIDAAIDGYDLTTTYGNQEARSYDVTLDKNNQAVTVAVTNTYTMVTGDDVVAPASLTIKKVDATADAKLLSGAKFKLLDTTDSNKYYIETTDTNGSLTFNNIPEGIYTLMETEAPANYIKSNTTWAVKVERTGTPEYILNQTTKKYDAHYSSNLTVTANDQSMVKFDNNTLTVTNAPKNATTVKINITKNVKVTGNTQPTAMPAFTFNINVGTKTLKAVSLTPVKQADGTWKVSQDVDVVVPYDDFDANGVATLTISEVKGNLTNWTYDGNAYTLKVTRDGKEYKETVIINSVPAEVKPIASFTFTNTYSYTYTPTTRPSNPIRRQQPTTTTTKPVQSVKTGDMGIALYAVTSLLSLSGTALLIKKRKDEK